VYLLTSANISRACLSTLFFHEHLFCVLVSGLRAGRSFSLPVGIPRPPARSLRCTAMPGGRCAGEDRPAWAAPAGPSAKTPGAPAAASLAGTAACAPAAPASFPSGLNGPFGCARKAGRARAGLSKRGVPEAERVRCAFGSHTPILHPDFGDFRT